MSSKEVIRALEDDLNSVGAIKVLHVLNKTSDLPSLKASARLLGLLDHSLSEWDWNERAVFADGYAVVKEAGASFDPNSSQIQKIVRKISEREVARRGKDFEASDRIRDELRRAGISIVDNADGSTGWKIAKECTSESLEALL
jgi:cysteinyl-tRNA synthetase